MVESTIQKLLNSGRPITANDVIPGASESLIAKREWNACVVRALAVVAGMDYDTAHREAKVHMNRKDRDGVRSNDIIKYCLDRPDSYEPVTTEPIDGVISSSNLKMVWLMSQGEFLKTTYKLKNGKELKCGMTVGSFAKRYDKGRYFVNVSGHAFAIVDGVIIGNVDDPKKRRAIVRFAFRAK
jgi:hypothetical protein